MNPTSVAVEPNESLTLLDNEGYLNATEITEDMLIRWSCSIRPIPVPEYVTPRGGVPLRDTPEDALMNVPAQVIAHIQRTASQKGLQIVSPRQTPFCKTMIRHIGGARRLGDHVVGSIANPDEVWPTIDSDDMAKLLPDEPLPVIKTDTILQPKTKTTPLTKANKLLSDPILACLVKGRAVVDILRRDDISGDADAVLQLLAEAWGVPLATLAELEAYTLGIDGPLLRHAIKVDEVYPMMYAPIHVRRCIAMGCSDVNQSVLPCDTALDWKRARVFCEAVFALAASIEGFPLGAVRCAPHPGDASAPTNRPGVLAFLPAPASAWTYAPSTFSIYPIVLSGTRISRPIPREVLESLTTYVTTVRPISHALEVGHRYATRSTTAKSVVQPNLETIADSYRIMVQTIHTGGGRGKTSAATIRHLIYQTMENLPDRVRLRLARFMVTAKEAVEVHLGLNTVPDAVIERIALRYTILGTTIRSSVAAEAARRGVSINEWWHDILSQAPASYHHFLEGSYGWTMVAMWLLFKGPTDKWNSLMKAVKISAISRAAAASVHGMPLPARKGSVERLLEAARFAVKEVTTAFASYYMGVADVGLAVSDVAQALGRTRTADILREGAFLWVLRARAFRGTNVHAIAHAESDKSPNHFRIRSDPVDLLVVPSPYRAFEAYVKHVEDQPLIAREVKAILRDDKGPVISRYFSEINRPMIVCNVSTVTRYLTHPRQLAKDMEEAWMLLVEDVKRVSEVYASEIDKVTQPSKKKAKPTDFRPGNLTIEMKERFDYYSCIGLLPYDQVEDIQSVIDELPPEIQDEMYSKDYEGPMDLLAQVQSLEREYKIHPELNIETVR